MNRTMCPALRAESERTLAAFTAAVEAGNRAFDALMAEKETAGAPDRPAFAGVDRINWAALGLNVGTDLL